MHLLDLPEVSLVLFGSELAKPDFFDLGLQGSDAGDVDFDEGVRLVVNCDEHALVALDCAVKLQLHVLNCLDLVNQLAYIVLNLAGLDDLLSLTN